MWPVVFTPVWLWILPRAFTAQPGQRCVLPILQLPCRQPILAIPLLEVFIAEDILDFIQGQFPALLVYYDAWDIVVVILSYHGNSTFHAALPFIFLNYSAFSGSSGPIKHHRVRIPVRKRAVSLVIPRLKVL